MPVPLAQGQETGQNSVASCKEKIVKHDKKNSAKKPNWRKILSIKKADKNSKKQYKPYDPHDANNGIHGIPPRYRPAFTKCRPILFSNSLPIKNNAFTGTTR
ncbi:hypothetical protein JCM17844_21320 [Iodidimonas gelatinilytica]|uniref:Uncharacterized protein n=1 Tax=Iodidimonas gelatinilytica TaxID=1236966 RepID=A0A5A7MY31_9PROT|nr:hypothetical protein JCM17844_21320 [Iodidimonas gelatinilytica]GER00335.1 hypothetical protein JCM17845_09580 [Iodidimonas gelatinilytica]